jgi:hypothetical protein
MKQWIQSYLSWLKSSKLGRIAAVQKNNQIHYYNLQVYVFSLFTGTSIEQVKGMIPATMSNVDNQINGAGEQIIELKRATPIGYSLFNLKAISLIALFSENIGGPDLWNYQKNGSSIKNALLWLNQQYINQKKGRKANPKFENILPGHLRGLYNLARPRIQDLTLSDAGISSQSAAISDTYFLFN